MIPAIRILHLEDDPVDARLIGEHLRRSGVAMQVSVAGNRGAFESALAAGGFDLVISDYHIPGFSGLEALRLVRGAAVQVPFILVTGALGDERAFELLRSGATDYVLKDRLARLVPAIERALSEQAAQKQHDADQARLAEAQQLSKLAAAAARMGTWHLHFASGKLECSDEFLNLIGTTRAAWDETAAGLEPFMHPLDVPRFRELYLGAAANCVPMELEIRIVQRDSEVRWMYLRGDCKSGDDGKPESYLGVMMDITARKQMEEALRDTDRRKDEFLATLAHELRNPLAPIHNGLSLLRRSAATPETGKIHTMLERQMNHIIRLVDDLLDVSRYTLGKIELKRAPVDLQTVMQNAVDMSRPLIDAARHHLDVSVPSKPVVLHADGVRLAQVLANLLNNSAKYTAEGGRLWLSASLQGNRAVISVRDTGVGIPESMLDRVFDLFTQLEPDGSGGRPGLGIGLAMVRMLVDLHGGEVEARSSGVGQGSEFIVRLPLSPEQNATAPNAGIATADTPLSGYRVLVVDDNYDSATSLGMLLTLAGADTQVANDGPGALKAMPAYLPDVVLLDIGMPGMDGYTVANRIREDARYRDVTLIALTGFGQEQDRVRSLAAGFNHHMTKPLDLDTLQTLLASLPSRAAARALRSSPTSS